jgi:biotin carboxylase
MVRRLLVLYAEGPLGPQDAKRAVSTLDAEVTFICRRSMIDDPATTLPALAEVGKVVEVDGDIATAAIEHAHAEPVDGVFVSSELLLPAGARVMAELGLPGHPPEAVQAMVRKDIQRTLLAEAGVPVPAWALIRDDSDIAEALATVTLPAVLKPARGMGSLATYRIDDPAELPARLADARVQYAASELVLGEEPVFLLEEFLGGDHPHPADPRLADMVTVESIMVHGEIHRVTVADKPPMSPPFRDTGHIVPSALPGSLLDEVTEMADRAVRAVGAFHGATHVEVKLTAAGPRVIEVNGRNGFALPVTLIFHGYDYLTDLLRVALGDRPHLPPPLNRHSVVLRVHTPPFDGEVAAIDGIEEIQRHPGVSFAAAVLPPGSRPRWQHGGESIAYVLGAAARTLPELLDLVDHAKRTVRVDYRPLP